MRKSLFDKQMDEFDKTPDEDNVHLAQRKPETILIDKELYDDLVEFLTDYSDTDWDGEGYITNRAMKLLSRLDKEKF